MTRHSVERRKQFLQLLLYKCYADLKTEAVSTRLGMLWWFLEPLIHMVIYYTVFAVFLHHGTDNFVVFILVGLASWRWFQSSLAQGAVSILSGKALMQHTYISRSFFPSVTLLTNGFKFGLTFVVLLVFMWVYGLTPTKAYIMLPVIVVLQFLWTAACVYFLAAITPFMPDLKVLLGNFLRGLMFLSGIFYDGDRIPEHLQTWFYMNPIATLIKSYRDILIDGTMPEWGHLMVVAIASLFLLVLGKRLIARFDSFYPRVV